MMTAQEVFDTVVAHLRAQGKQSLQIGEGCVYRSSDGLKCAVGCLIEDAEYDPAMETKTVGQVIRSTSFHPDLRRRLTRHSELLIDLQGAHDHHKPDAWESKFIQIARHHKLTLAPPNA